MKALLADSMAILAPNANSYRRFRANSYAPVAPVWGVNNRTCAFRVPAGAPPTRHIEHRVAGATRIRRWRSPFCWRRSITACPKLDPGPAVTGDGYAHAEETGERIPANWFAAVDRFEQSAVYCATIWEKLRQHLCTVKRTEQERFFGVISNVDYDWYLRGA